MQPTIIRVKLFGVGTRWQGGWTYLAMTVFLDNRVAAASATLKHYLKQAHLHKQDL